MKIDWEKMNNLIPAIIQDYATGQVYMLGYMSQESLNKTEETGYVWFYSRSKDRLWQKGETSGNTLNVKDISTDCDGDALLILVEPNGPVCHEGTDSCFKSTYKNAFANLYRVLESRKKEMPEGSYTASLLQEGTDKICAKIDEEAAEVINAAKNETKQRLVEESIDLIYHLVVLCVSQDITNINLDSEMQKRAS